ncbi:hypothetical protein DSO57_1014599 [Entomophthora muscae]|uniref:Uncharacterized protein n=1 Tax=Entomophthora muscae TaxID=34485 RepID=A0ACC2UES0_9FUNG|nr:hypothetical protein DSO57_1014599 [Entomophthora muscae]
MLLNPFLFVISAALAGPYSNPCIGNKGITPENIKSVRKCRTYSGSLMLDGILSPGIVSLHYMEKIYGDLVLNNYQGVLTHIPHIDGSLKIFNQEAYAFSTLQDVREVASLVLRNVSANMYFNKLIVTKSIQVINSSATSIKGLEARDLEKIYIKDCPNLDEFQLGGLQNISRVKISNTSLMTFDFLKNVIIEGDLFIEN